MDYDTVYFDDSHFDDYVLPPEDEMDELDLFEGIPSDSDATITTVGLG